MKNRSTIRILWSALAPVVAVCWGELRAVDFNREIRPILAENCFECHGPDGAQRKAGLRLDSREGLFGRQKGLVVVAGEPERSELYRRVAGLDGVDPMPPPEAHRRPSPAEIAVLRQWISEGAAYAEHWAFVPPVRGTLPPAGEDSDSGNAIDRFVRAKLALMGSRPSPEAHRATLIRRLSLDLCGLPPTPEEVARYEADGAAGSYDRLVARLLASPRFGEQMAWSWMEAARYADTDGFQSDATRHMWRWRDWVVEAFNRNLSYDQFAIEQLAGDLLPGSTSEQRLATGFNRNHRYDKGSGTIQAESVFENAADRLETTATVWLGLTMNCARCHDHKFDPISSREYYELLGFFDRVPENGQAILFNSHPRMMTPTWEQAERLAEFETQVSRTEAAWRQMEPTIAAHQRGWEQKVRDDDWTEGPILRDGLAKLFHLDGPEAEGAPRNGGVRFVSGVRGRAMSFAGRGHYEFSRQVGNLWGRNEFSLAFWFRLDDLRDGALLSELDDPDDLRIGTVIDIKDGRLRFMLSHRWNYAVTWFELKQTLQAGRWYHFAVTCDGQVQMLAYQAYLDGVAAPINVIQDSAVDGKKINEPLLLGASPLGPGFRGALDELRFQERVLSPAEIAMLAVPSELPAIAAKPAAVRSRAEGLLLRQHFLEHEMSGVPAAALKAWQLAQRARKAYADSLPTTMVMRDEITAPTAMRLKGRFDQPGDLVAATTPKILPPMGAELPRNRLGFARWLFEPSQPLTARVAVNRLWQQFFGRGFVDSPENFGTQCPKPLQAELLDWLATEFVRLNWDVKAMVRLIVSSAVYRQTSSATEEQWRMDPENRHLGRGPRHRLAAAAVRDQSLAVGGLLVGELGGGPVFPYQPEGLWRLTSNTDYEPSAGAGQYRRSLYTYWRRSIAPPTMALFDASGREFCNVGFRPTNTPLQALATLNEPSFVAAARGLAGRMIAAGGASDAARVIFGFRAGLARDPSPAELEAMLGLLADGRIAGDLRWVHLAGLLLNLDETLTKQ